MTFLYVRYAIVVLFFFGYFACFGQVDTQEITEEVLGSALPAPNGLAVTNVPFGSFTATTITIKWTKSEVTNTYDVEVRRSSDDRMQVQAYNHPFPWIYLEKMDPGTEYNIIVRAIANNGIKSPFSKPYTFKMQDPCRSGQVFTPCLGHCPVTCRDKSPTCARICVPGCTCPIGMFLEGGVCILEKNCEREINRIKLKGDFRRPKNLQMIPLRGGEPKVLLTWDNIPGADSYTVTVIVDETGEIHEKAVRISVPHYVVENLKRGVKYNMVVTAVWTESGIGARDFTISLVQLSEPTVVNVTDNSIKISWLPDELEGTESFTVQLYDSDISLLINFIDLQLNHFTIGNLQPGTDYKVSYSVNMKNVVDNTTLTFKSPIIDVKTTGDFNISTKYPTGAFVEATLEDEPIVVTTTPAPTTPAPVASCEEIYVATELIIDSNPDLSAGIKLPNCDEEGNYESKQCTGDICVCVDVMTGSALPHSDFKSSWNIDCDNYGTLLSSPSDIEITVIDTNSILVSWTKSGVASTQNIVKVFGGVTNELEKYELVQDKSSVTIGNLLPGTRYKVVVIDVNVDGWTGNDKLQGKDTFTPYLNPPDRLKISEFNSTSFTIKWSNDPTASHYFVELYDKTTNSPIVSIDRLEDNAVVFAKLSVNGSYRATVSARSVRSDPTTGEDTVVSSEPSTIDSVVRCTPPPIDVILGFDVSRKLGNGKLLKVKKMFLKIVNRLVNNLSQDGNRIAAVKYGPDTKKVFGFDKQKGKNGLSSAVNNVRLMSGSNLNLDRAVKFIFNEFFDKNSKEKPRSSVPSAVIMFVGGASDSAVSSGDVNKLKQETNVIAFGVQEEADNDFMNMVALENGSTILLDSYSDLDIAFNAIMRMLCQL